VVGEELAGNQFAEKFVKLLDGACSRCCVGWVGVDSGMLLSVLVVGGV
jgi:hypothetical protein